MASLTFCFRAFLIADVKSREMDISTSGATAVVCLLKRGDNGERTLYTANVGDSRAVLCCSNSLASTSENISQSGMYARRLTFDHRAEDEAEQKRIKDAGGFIARHRYALFIL